MQLNYMDPFGNKLRRSFEWLVRELERKGGCSMAVYNGKHKQQQVLYI